MWRIITSTHYPTMQLLWLAEEESSFCFFLDVVSFWGFVAYWVKRANRLSLLWTCSLVQIRCLCSGFRGSQKDIVYLGWPIAPSYMSPNARGGGLRCLCQWVQLYTWGPNKLWRSYFIFNRWAAPSPLNFAVTCQCASFFVASFKSAALAADANLLCLRWYIKTLPL